MHGPPNKSFIMELYIQVLQIWSYHERSRELAQSCLFISLERIRVKAHKKIGDSPKVVQGPPKTQFNPSGAHGAWQ